MSRYGEKLSGKNIHKDDPTVLTRSMESTDTDNFIEKMQIDGEGPTYLTENTETSDPDAFTLLFDPTKFTFTQESTDEDSFMPFFV